MDEQKIAKLPYLPHKDKAQIYNINKPSLKFIKLVIIAHMESGIPCYI